jgi:hypothetical protein
MMDENLVKQVATRLNYLEPLNPGPGDLSLTQEQREGLAKASILALDQIWGDRFEYELLGSTEEVRERIQLCEGQHVQQAIFSTFMDTLTQVCFTEQKIRSTIQWEGNRSWTPGK